MPFVFIYDEAKSCANRDKHGIDFIEAQALWSDPRQLRTAARTVDEPRFIVVGKIEGRHWSAVVTYRGETIRLISVRRSRAKEVQAYESK